MMNLNVVNLDNTVAIYHLVHLDIVVMYYNPMEDEQQNFDHYNLEKVLEVFGFFSGVFNTNCLTPLVESIFG